MNGFLHLSLPTTLGSQLPKPLVRAIEVNAQISPLCRALGGRCTPALTGSEPFFVCWAAGKPRRSHAAASRTRSSPRAMGGTGRGGGAGLSFHHTWSPASISFLTGLTATAEARAKPRWLPRLPRLSALGSERCHRAPHLSLRSPLCSESRGGGGGQIRDKRAY